MKTDHFILCAVLLIGITGCARWRGDVPGQPPDAEFKDAGEAYARMLEQAGGFADWSDHDWSAIRVLQKSLDTATEKRLTGDLSFTLEEDASEVFARAFAVFQQLPDDERQLGIARRAWATYPAGSRSALSLYIAVHGGESDLKRVADEIAADPDGWGISLALALRESADPAAHALLERLGHAVDPGEPDSDGTRAGHIPLPHEVEDPREQALRSDDPLPGVPPP